MARPAIGLIAWRSACSTGIQQDVISFGLALNACKKAKTWRNALELFFQMPSKKVLPNSVILNTLIAASAFSWSLSYFFLSSAGVLRVQNDVRSWGSAAAGMENWQLAQRMLWDVEASMVELDAMSYTAGMLASAQQGHWRRDVERLAKMAMFSERQGAVRAVCQSCCEGAAWLMACDFLVARDAFVVASSGKACVAASQWSRTLAVLCRSGLQLDLVSRNVAIEAAVQSGWKDALLLHLLYPFAPDRIACNSILRACDIGAWPKAREIFSGMASSNLQMAAESCSAVIATSPGHWEMLVGQMQQKCQLNSVVYNAAINSCEWRQAWQLLQQMRVRSLRQDSITMNSAIGLKGDWKKAMQLSDTLQRSGIESTVETHGSILTSLEWSHAMEHLSAMLQSSLRATDVSCGAAMRTCKAPWRLCCFLLQWVPDDRYCHSYAMSACALQEVPGGLLRR